MSKGKFSQPRPYRDEEREIEKAFREMTGQAPKEEPFVPLPEDKIPAHFPEIDEKELDAELGIQADMDFAEEEEEPAEPDFVDKALVFCGENRKLVLAALCALALVTILSFIAAIMFSTSDPYGGKILSNVYIANVNVGGMTKNEAVSALKQATGYATQDMIVDIAGTPLILRPGDTKVSLDAKAAVSAAYDYGRTGPKEAREQILEASRTKNHYIGLLPYLTMDEAYIRKVLTDYAQDIGSTLKQTNYGLEGDYPELSTDKFSETAPTQTLVINMGTPGAGFDPETVYQQVLDAYSLHLFRVEVAETDPVAEPDPIDLEQIYEELYVEPVNASIDMQTFEPIPGTYGYHFDLEAAQALLDSAQYGDQLRIPMEYITPEIMDEDVFFRDVLGSAETRHSNNSDRTTNLKLACEAINGLVLNPGEEFSYNKTLGERTAAKGYKPAPSYSGLETVDTIGGGICQVSSTLYYSVLKADLTVTDRRNHGFVPSYIDYGMDATVSWGGPDFKFKNSTNYPIKIEAEVSGGYVKIKLLGTDEKDYYVKMEYEITNTYKPETEYKDFPHDNEEGYKDGDVIKEGTTGYAVKTYKLKYDKSSNALLSKDFEANSRYVTVNKVIARVEEEETEPPTTLPPTTEPPVTEPPVTQPPETQPPATEPAETQPPVTEPDTDTDTDANTDIDPDSDINPNTDQDPPAAA